MLSANQEQVNAQFRQSLENLTTQIERLNYKVGTLLSSIPEDASSRPDDSPAFAGPQKSAVSREPEPIKKQ